MRDLVLKRSPTGVAFLKVLLLGRLGSQNLDVVPPDPVTDVGIVLQIGNQGGTYCIRLGGAAGGQVREDDALGVQIINATAEPGCPAP